MSIINNAIIIAETQIKYGESSGNNRGAAIYRYRRNDGTGKRWRGSGSWCGAFASYCLRRATLTRGDYDLESTRNTTGMAPDRRMAKRQRRNINLRPDLRRRETGDCDAAGWSSMVQTLHCTRRKRMNDD